MARRACLDLGSRLIARVEAGKRASLSDEASRPSLFSSLATACAPPRCVERDETKTRAPFVRVRVRVRIRVRVRVRVRSG